MKKLIFFSFFCVFALSAFSQIPTDTADFNNKVRTWIITNGSKQITAQQINNLFLGVTKIFNAYGADSLYIDTATNRIYCTRHGGKSTLMLQLKQTGAGSPETDPTVPAAVKTISSTDISNWNGKQAGLSTGTGIDITANVITGRTDSALWNANKIFGRPIDGTINPIIGQTIKWNGTAWAPANDSTGAGTALTVENGLSKSNDSIRLGGLLLKNTIIDGDGSWSLNMPALLGASFESYSIMDIKGATTVVESSNSSLNSVSIKTGAATTRFKIDNGGSITLPTLISNTDTTANKPAVFNPSTKVLTYLDHWPIGTGGSGLSSLNGLSVSTQTFATGSSGSDFGISSSGTAHTFNLPNSSGSNRGLLTSADWTTFNGKQAALGFTPENIANKNVNSGYAGLNGSGKVAWPQLDSNHITGVVSWPGLLAQGYGSGGSDSGNAILGSLYQKGSWTTGTLATDFIGHSASISGTSISLTSASNNYNAGEGLQLPDYECLEHVHCFVAYRNQTAISSTSNGGGVGPVSTATAFPTELQAWVGQSNNGTYGNGRLNLSNGTNILAYSASNLSWSTGDRIEVTEDRVGNVVKASARNATTNSLPIYAEYIYGTLYNFTSSTNMPNTGHFAIRINGGTILVDSFSVTSQEPIGADILVLQDSKGVGYNGNWENSHVNLLRNVYGSVVNLSGGGNKVIDEYNLLPLIYKLKPHQVLFQGGANDATDSASIKTYFKATIDSLHAHNIPVFPLLPFYQATPDFTWQVNWMYRTLAVDSIIDTWTPTHQFGAISGDSLHESNYGDTLIFNAIIGFGKLKGAKNYRNTLALDWLYKGVPSPKSYSWGNLSVFKNISNGLLSAYPYILLGINSPVIFGDANDATGNRKVYFRGDFDFAGLEISTGEQFVMTPGLGLCTASGGFNANRFGKASTSSYVDMNDVDSTVRLFSAPGGANTMKFGPAGLLVGGSSMFSRNAVLKLFSTTQGFLPPSMTTTQINAIPVVGADSGMIVFDKTTGSHKWYNGSAWMTFAGTSTPFTDASALVKNSSDATRLVILSAASITTGTTRTWTFPDVSGTFARIDAAQTMTGNQTFSTSITTPLILGSGSPSIAAGSGAGSGSATSINGTAISGRISVNAGASPGTNSVICTVTLPVTMASTNYNIIFSPSTVETGALNGTVFAVATSTTTFTLNSGATALTASGAYAWDYIIVGR